MRLIHLIASFFLVFLAGQALSDALPEVDDPGVSACVKALLGDEIERHERDLTRICHPGLADPKTSRAPVVGAVVNAIANYHAGMFLLEGEAKLDAFARAKAFAAQAVKAKPDRVEPWFWLGAATACWAKEKGKFSQLSTIEAIRDAFGRAIAIDPSYLHAGALRARGKLYSQAPGWPLSVGDKAKGRKDLEDALKLHETRRNLIYLAEFFADQDECATTKKLLAQAAAKPRILSKYEEAHDDALVKKLETTCAS